jgi:hypothetical protein
MTDPTCHQLEAAVSNFAQWLGQYGETSYDFQMFYAGTLSRRAKQLCYWNRPLGTLAVSPIIFCEALVPSARRFFFVKQRFPIADAHFAMNFASRFRFTRDRADIGGPSISSTCCWKRGVPVPLASAGATPSTVERGRSENGRSVNHETALMFLIVWCQSETSRVDTSVNRE